MGLEKLLYLRGVGADFTDCFGQYIRIPETDRQGILTCMLKEKNALASGETCTQAQLALLGESGIEAQIHRLDAQHWTQVLPTFHWCYVDEPWLNLYLPQDYTGELAITVACEHGESIAFDVPFALLKPIGNYRIQHALFGEGQYIQYRLDLVHDDLGLGYHGIALKLKSPLAVSRQRTENPVPKAFHGTLMVAPRAAYQGVLSATLQGKRHKPWGVSVQLYSLRSDSQWGMGDFGDLEELIAFLASHGADFIQLNPLHALDIAAPEHPSPYSPCDRRRLNPLYIHLQSVPEYEPLASEFTSSCWQEAIAALNRNNWLDYPKVSELKYRAFARLYGVFCEVHLAKETPRAKRFNDFVAEQGAALVEFAQAESLRSPRAIAQDEGFYLYLQFVAETQLQLCQLRAKEAGMGIGLIRDLAVGAALQGVEVQANSEQFCLNASIGAPPDPFAPQGQNWGLTPLDPVKLKQHDYRHFIELIRANMENCGALRIDHVMGLLRLWWWPLEKQLGGGAYVYYPVETLLAIVCLESQRARCIVIGEDLGLVPPDIIHRLYHGGIYSNELFYFCKEGQGFKLPSQYKSQSLMMLANHDVPTLVAWWCGSDLHLRRQLTLFASDGQLDEALTAREYEKQQLVSLLIQQKLLPDSAAQEVDINELLTAWMTLGASGCSALYSVQWCDLLGDRHAVNIPGTWLEYPNWQRRLPLGVTQAKTRGEIRQRLQNIASARQLSLRATHSPD
ncbi:4-alpha-glucanotransferase [Shewanella sp. CG12_big_fil_rev_8_21_14_0_65_47_15]|uniref:4-alpha-glucanotransferase n=1 Tax=Shewanella sp. CG12_big_fil_rev_8_21_14_0_65_47_15 TaxID=1975537 RepID=UPI000CC113AD|nr:4-alpha-glucanotransferase [Shewanella sp. CG12_big_fil_rev_8_21_14_0_65_47_15]PIW59501.1 MAG: 4-alpha-glucanotransferase [Shewanella sp. CG12_big_fil_rev_8_21_14_0_65_47_15]